MKHRAFLYLGSLLVLGATLIGASSLPDISGTWATASSKGFGPRAWFTSSVVNGKIYVIGGANDSATLGTLQVFNPSTNTWSTPATTGSFTSRFALASSTLNGKIYVLGGSTIDEKPEHMTNALEVFNPSTNTWSTPTTTGTFTPRNILSSVVLNNKIYALGGFNGKDDLNTLEIFDPSTNTWSTPVTTGTFKARGAFAAQAVKGKIYVMGGFSNSGTVQVFDPKTNAWSTLITTGTFDPRYLLTCGVIRNKIYVVGGTKDGRNPLTANSLQVFDPSTNMWSTPKAVGVFTPRAYLSSGVVNNKIYVLGGQDTSNVLNTNEVFTPVLKG